MDHFCGSSFWDLNITWNTDSPNFTPCFQNTVLVWIPCAFLWLFSPLEIWYIKNSKYKDIPWNLFNISKLVLMSLLLILNIFNLGMLSQKSENYIIHQVEYVSPTIQMLTIMLSILLFLYNRSSGLRSSGHQFLFWLLLTMTSIPQMISVINNIHHGSDTHQLILSITYIVYFIIISVIFVLNFFADGVPTYTLFEHVPNPCPEFTRSFPIRVTFSWFGELARLGFKKTLVFEDLWALNGEDRLSTLIPQFNKYWELMKYKVSINKRKSLSVAPILWKCYKGTLLFGMFLKLLQLGVTFIPPKILSYLIQFIEGNEYHWRGYLYVAVLFMSGSLQTLFQHLYFHKMLLVETRARAVLTSEIYKKALKLSNKARQQSTVGEIVNMMAVDVQNLAELALYLALWWSAPLQIGLAVFFLWQILGYSVFAGLAALLILMPVNAYLTNKLTNLQKEQMETKDQRIKLLHELLQGIKVLKLYAWEMCFNKQVSKIRDKELGILKTSFFYRAGTSLVWNTAPFLVSVVTFATFILSDKNHILDTKTAIVALSLFNLLRFPLSQVPWALTGTIQAYVSLKRINNFLNAKELNQDDVHHDESEVYALSMEHCYFTWDEEENPTLKDINLNVSHGSLIAIVGTVGSGKSSLLSAFLGEMNKIDGYVNTTDKIAYVTQQAWIKNDTLKDNILFGKEYNERFYNSILEACALKPDLDILPAGDQTEIGEKGINLSGGQKLRVALARAVYNDCQIYFLDDPLSAVDSHVGKHIFKRVISNSGILSHKTRLLVTHSITYLTEVDQVVVMKNGQISETGTFLQLLKAKGEFSEFLLKHLNDENQVDEDDEISSIKLLVKDTLGSAEFEKRVRLMSQSSTASQTSSADDKDPTRRKIAGEKSTPEKDILIKNEGMEEGNIKWSVFTHYLKRLGIGFIIMILFFCFIYEVASLGSNVWLSKWSSDSNVTANGTIDIKKRDYYLGIYGAFGFAQASLSFFNELVPLFACLAVCRAMHSLLLHNVLRSPLSFFEKTPVGRILQRFSKDTQVIDADLPQSILDCLYYFFEVCATVALISYSTPIFLAVVIPIAILYFFIQRYYVTTSRQIQRIDSVSRSPIYAHFSESLTGTSVIRAFGLQDEFIKTLDDKVERNLTCFFSMIVANRWLAIRLEMIGNFIILFSALFAILERDKVNPGLVGLSVTYSLQITVLLNWFVRLSAQIETNVVSVERIKEYTENVPEASWEDTEPLYSEWPKDGHISFDQLCVKYRVDSEPVLHDLSFHIMAGEKIGIVGRTGSGKSSLTLALFRILEADRGRILIDGLDISKVGLHTLRSKLTIIPQDPVLFSGTLRMNLDPFYSHTDDEIWTALEHAHLRSCINEFPLGLHHNVSESGENFSVGQRQLICLARALLRQTKILVLDEATASVDLETDALIQQTITEKFSNCTVLTIAHRLNTVMDSQRVLVLDAGRIIEFDSPSVLLQKKSSVFFKMAKEAGVVN